MTPRSLWWGTESIAMGTTVPSCSWVLVPLLMHTICTCGQKPILLCVEQIALIHMGHDAISYDAFVIWQTMEVKLTGY